MLWADIKSCLNWTAELAPQKYLKENPPGRLEPLVNLKLQAHILIPFPLLHLLLASHRERGVLGW